MAVLFVQIHERITLKYKLLVLCLLLSFARFGTFMYIALTDRLSAATTLTTSLAAV